MEFGEEGGDMERGSWEVEDGCWGVDWSKTKVILEKAREWGWACDGLRGLFVGSGQRFWVCFCFKNNNNCPFGLINFTRTNFVIFINLRAAK